MIGPRCSIFNKIGLYTLILTGFASILLGINRVFAAQATPSDDDVIRGAQLYDKWYAILGVEPPAGNMPIWGRQTTNTRSGADTWRCSECHGWDYRGAQGEYKAGSHYTGFPDIYTLVQDLQVEDIVSHLNGKIDPAHDFSPYMDETSINQLASFLKFGIIDDSEYINPTSMDVIDGDPSHGQTLFLSNCADCHGQDGKKIPIGIEGFTEYLGSVANRDPWRFLHRTRFGVAGIDMPVGVKLGWTPADGRDVLAFARTLPQGEITVSQPTQRPQLTPTPQYGGPSRNVWTGILTILGVIIGMGVVAISFIVGFVILALIVVILLRRRGKRNM